ncbi:IS66 family insertion sequence element accessory protein TnpB [Xenorhabdus bovienii]|uniref:IS66 family insertion sequence element accessory protein TnpB n=1 Tax=Xenorhabdus bovienii TaxID=40576 RepID=UPI0023B34EA3|nr:IS66 family insertion sequence element accessory protein TnpB [Xenorhabdus bovienii]MDE9557816.1 IS66 family insertion sequence element accessory protein TnpB [Xenorhabdus bovienii]
MKMFVDVPDVYLCRSFIDFRKSISGLAVWVELEMQLSPTQTALFLFCNKKRDKLKILYWDKTGFALWYKRLENAKFKWPIAVNSTTLTLTEQQLHGLLSGYDVIGHQPFPVQDCHVI